MSPGRGTTTLTGISTYGGATSVTNGTLLVDGSIAGSSGLTVASGATVGGTGTPPSTTIAAGGFLAPGNPGIGTLTVGGSLTLAPGATTIIRVNGAASDRLNVAGAATLSGNLRVAAQSPSFNNPYTDGECDGRVERRLHRQQRVGCVRRRHHANPDL